MAFTPINYDSGKLIQLPTAASITFAKGNAVVDNGSGYITNAASSTAVDVYYVAAEDLTSGASVGDMLTCYVTEGIRFVADTDANPAQTDVGTYADLATVSTVNPDASTNDLFYIESIKGAVADKKVIGYFVHGTPNS